MRKILLLAAVAAFALPASAQAQTFYCKSGTGGSVLGSIVGAITGTPTVNCNDWNTAPEREHAYGYYDAYGVWHVGPAHPAPPQGYYDRAVRWVQGYPPGYYGRNGHWVSTTGAPATTGYYDANGYWVPGTAYGYYDATGN